MKQSEARQGEIQKTRKQRNVKKVFAIVRPVDRSVAGRSPVGRYKTGHCRSRDGLFLQTSIASITKFTGYQPLSVPVSKMLRIIPNLIHSVSKMYGKFVKYHSFNVQCTALQDCEQSAMNKKRFEKLCISAVQRWTGLD